MDFLFGYIAGVATVIVLGVIVAFVIFYYTPDEPEDDFALRVRDLNSGGNA